MEGPPRPPIRTNSFLVKMLLWLKKLQSGKMRCSSQKINYPSAERNQPFILEVLQKYIDSETPSKLLEVASGTGQHAAYLATKLPQLTIQPSELEVKMFASIRAYASEVPNRNVKDPVRIDAKTWPWNVDCDFDYILNVNMFHIAPLNCSRGFFENGAKVLKNGGLMFTYGPYALDGVIEPQSNVDFNEHIRTIDPNCGLKDIRDLQIMASEQGIGLKHMYDLPANNKCLVWEKNIPV